MNILVFGGTGAIGKHTADILAQKNDVYVTSRVERKSNNENIHYIIGNAKNLEFVTKVIKKKSYDVIIDFMVYTIEELRERVDIFLKSTNQYIFISSARVYADSKEPITENSPRLLDISTDKEYLKTEEYALLKAREENILFQKKEQGYSNFTIIRPSLTYSNNRLQLGVLEKENWIYRALKGRPIVFSKDLMTKHYTMTTGVDVAKGISSIVGKKEALGETFHIVQKQSYMWKEILELYLDTFEEVKGKRPKVYLTDKSTNLLFEGRKYQVIYGRYFDRLFNNSKIGEYVDVDKFVDPKIGLKQCFTEFLEKPHFLDISWDLEAVNDRVSKSWTPLNEISSWKNKIKYLVYRLHLEGILKIVKR